MSFLRSSHILQWVSVYLRVCVNTTRSGELLFFSTDCAVHTVKMLMLLMFEGDDFSAQDLSEWFSMRYTCLKLYFGGKLTIPLG